MAKDTKLIGTSVKGLDNLLSGGIPENSQVLVSGSPGSGKTLLAFELLYRAAKNGVQSTFITLDENPDNLLKNAKSAFSDMGDIDDLVKKGLLSIEGDQLSTKIATTVDPEAYSFGDLISDLETVVKSHDSKLVAIDSLSFIKMILEKSVAYRRSLVSLISNMRRLNLTAFYTLDLPSPNRGELDLMTECFLFDGLIALYQIEEEHDRTASMEIIKMRGNSHSRALIPFEITGGGIQFTNV